MDKLQTLKQIFEQGFISNDEYQTRKKALIDNLTLVNDANVSTTTTAQQDVLNLQQSNALNQQRSKKRRISNGTEDDSVISISIFEQKSSIESASSCVLCQKSDTMSKVQCESCRSLSHSSCLGNSIQNLEDGFSCISCVEKRESKRKDAPMSRLTRSMVFKPTQSHSTASIINDGTSSQEKRRSGLSELAAIAAEAVIEEITTTTTTHTKTKKFKSNEMKNSSNSTTTTKKQQNNLENNVQPQAQEQKQHEQQQQQQQSLLIGGNKINIVSTKSTTQIPVATKSTAISLINQVVSQDEKKDISKFETTQQTTTIPIPTTSVNFTAISTTKSPMKRTMMSAQTKNLTTNVVSKPSAFTCTTTTGRFISFKFA